ncbi:hypothetical protein JCM33374_g1683 [Metschnikowia sp. JCM 33374]|nr:hypothetical protein JCM33374_g1683 [Metschnikowia sp. JCM 33374]
MPKDNTTTITVRYPWKHSGEPVTAVYNDSGQSENVGNAARKSQNLPPDKPEKQSVLQTHLSPSNISKSAGPTTNYTHEKHPEIHPDFLSHHRPSVPSHPFTSPTHVNTPTWEQSTDASENGRSSDDGGGGHMEEKRGPAPAPGSDPASEEERRKDKYIKDLETTALRVPELEKTIDKLRKENAHLKEYTLVLQRQLGESNATDSDHTPSTVDGAD